MLLSAIILLALAPAETKGDSAEVKKLLQKRIEVLREAHKLAMLKFKAGQLAPEAILPFIRELAQAELDAADGVLKRREALLRIFKLAVQLDEIASAHVKAGTMLPSDFLKARSFRLKAEIDLRRAGGKPPKDIVPPKDP